LDPWFYCSKDINLSGFPILRLWGSPDDGYSSTRQVLTVEKENAYTWVHLRFFWVLVVNLTVCSRWLLLEFILRFGHRDLFLCHIKKTSSKIYPLLYQYSRLFFNSFFIWHKNKSLFTYQEIFHTCLLWL
jgi:hypothetical protein